MNLFGLFQQWTGNPASQRAAWSDRVMQYARYLRAYQGYSVRGVINTGLVQEWKRIKFNFIQPVVNLSAGWFAAKPIDWEIDGDAEATREAYAIWDRSGSDRTLLESAICCGIYGDLVGIATRDADGRPAIEFVDPSIAEPTFDGSDYARLTALEIAYEAPDDANGVVVRREMWGPAGMEAYSGDTLVSRCAYDRLPAAWIRNSSVKGVPFGISDVEPILDLVEEYDHLAAKQTRIVDYYAAPNIVFSGLQKSGAPVERSVGTVFHLPADGKAYFLEWSGGAPDIDNQLTRIRNAIAEVSQVPAVAFGTVDSGISNISGVAIKILYGPLLSKTQRKQANWGPALEYLMWLCLRNAGYRSTPLSAVNVRFPSATPVDGQAAVAEASGRIAARLSSRRTEMKNQGVEDVDGELRRIVEEERMLQLATTGVDLATDANTAARVSRRGGFAEELASESAGS